MPECSRPKILFLVSLLFVALLNSIPTYLLNFQFFYHIYKSIITITYVPVFFWRILQLDRVLSRLYFCCVNKIVGLYKTPRNELLATSRCLQPSGM